MGPTSGLQRCAACEGMLLLQAIATADIAAKLTQDLLPGYRAAITAYFDALTALGFRLLHLLALSLDLEETYFDDKFRQPIALLRPLHYSPLLSAPDQVRLHVGGPREVKHAAGTGSVTCDRC